MAEWQAVWDLDRNREIEEIRRKADDEKKTSVEDTKKKQWCSQCMKVKRKGKKKDRQRHKIEVVVLPMHEGKEEVKKKRIVKNTK